MTKIKNPEEEEEKGGEAKDAEKPCERKIIRTENEKKARL